MKANELMIGDWILGLVEDNEQVGKVIAKHPARVTEINQNGDFSAECPYAFDELFDGDGHKIDDFLWYDTEPIPLTAEILEKNFSSTPIWYFEGTDKYQLRITLYKDKWHFFFGRDGKGTNIQINIQYVHELQHALRLCGLNELADNFIV